MSEETARKLAAMLWEISGELNSSVGWVSDSESEDVGLRYRHAVADALFAILTVLNPIYAQYPELRPNEMAEQGQ